jgi:hypothetical protein
MSKKRKIRRVKDLPAAFDIRRYDAARQSDVGGWERQLSRRRSLDYLLTHLSHANVDELLLEPIVPERDLTLDSKLLANGRAILRKSLGNAGRFLHTYTLDHFLEQCETLIAVDALKQLREERRGYWRNEDIIGNEMLATPAARLDGDQYCSLIVDLTAPDNEVIAEFKRWLVDMRNEQNCGEKSIITQKDLDDWVSSGLLPYIDLTLWARSQNASINQHVMGEAIFPDEDSVETTDRIRRTTRPKAQALLRVDLSRVIFK